MAHPMLEEHYIQFIELIADGRSYKAFLNPGDAPEAEFCLEASAVIAREHCNLHGLWRRAPNDQRQMQDAFNEQINSELYSEYLYLAMAGY